MTLSGTVRVFFCLVLTVLIPLLVDDPLWELEAQLKNVMLIVLIPLLVDDPLWVYYHALQSEILRLNPSFSG